MLNTNYKTMRKNSRKYMTEMRCKSQPVVKHTLVDGIARFISTNSFIIAIFIMAGFSVIFGMLLADTLKIDTNAATNTEIDHRPYNAITEIPDYDIPEYEIAEEYKKYFDGSYNWIDHTVTEDVESSKVTEELTPTLEEQLGNNTINIDGNTLVKHDLPDVYYPDIDFSSFQPYMPYTAVTNPKAAAYDVVHSINSYTDEYGLRRYYRNPETEFTINGQHDYMIALGTFYKDKGVVGNRYLVVTTNGMYTATTGDEKCDTHTEQFNMFTSHVDGTKAGMIEWIVDPWALNDTIRTAGTVTVGGPEVVQGEILYIYEIQ